jgi:tRNA-dihydrouridine synthase B
MFKINDISFGHVPLLLAPMEDVTDPVFRYFCKKYGADIVYTEFVSSDGLAHNSKKTAEKLNIFDYERPIGIQIYGHIPEAMVQAAKMVEGANPDIIDINFGCPVKKIARRGAGCGMMRDVPTMVKITEDVVKAVNKPVTVKTRLAWDQNTTKIDDIAERLQDVGIKALTIHGRTGAQLYTGEADWTLIGKVKNNPRIKIPIIGNGDVTSGPSAVEKLNRYGVDGIMIGRATIGKPWIFQEIKAYMENGRHFDLSLDEKIDHIIEHLDKSIEYRGERIGVLLLRRHLAQYFKSLPHFREYKIKLLTAEKREDLMETLEAVRKTYANTIY